MRRRQRVPAGPYGSGNARHGLSAQMIEAMRVRQQGRCAVCLGPLPMIPAVDHDHLAAAGHGHPVTRGCPRCVRGLLCNPCNSMLGFARDDPTLLDAAAAYLRRWFGR